MNWETIITSILFIISSILAIWQNNKAQQNKKEKEESEKTANAEKQNTKVIIEFFDPNNSNWTAPINLPVSTYMMDDITKKYITEGMSDEDIELVNNKIKYAEDNKIVSYEIEYSKGYYIIQYGLIKTRILKQFA